MFDPNALMGAKAASKALAAKAKSATFHSDHGYQHHNQHSDSFQFVDDGDDNGASQVKKRLNDEAGTLPNRLAT